MRGVAPDRGGGVTRGRRRVEGAPVARVDGGASRHAIAAPRQTLHTHVALVEALRQAHAPVEGRPTNTQLLDLLGVVEHLEHVLAPRLGLDKIRVRLDVLPHGRRVFT